jgi:hypothetical protein
VPGQQPRRGAEDRGGAAARRGHLPGQMSARPRLVARNMATNANLEKAIAAGKFREGL